MNTLLRSGLLALVCLASLLLVGCSRKPAGYSYFLEHHVSIANGGLEDPKEAAGYAAQWLKDWRGTLAFFSSELDSSDPVHVKTAMVCLPMMAMTVEKVGASDLGAEGTAEFEKAFPVDKLKQRITEHPEYYKFLYAIKYSRTFVSKLPPPPGWQEPK